MAQKLSKTTTDHETIRRWAEERGGKPSEVASTAREGDVGIIRIDFPGFGGEGTLQEISWDDWFRKFDDLNLALVYQDETSGGERSNFNKLVARETAAARAEGTRTSRRTGGRNGAARPRKSSGRNGAAATRKSSGRGAQGGRRTAGRAMAAKTAGRSASRSRTGAKSRSGSRTGSRSGGSRSGSRGGSRSGRRSR